MSYTEPFDYGCGNGDLFHHYSAICSSPILPYTDWCWVNGLLQFIWNEAQFFSFRVSLQTSTPNAERFHFHGRLSTHCNQLSMNVHTSLTTQMRVTYASRKRPFPSVKVHTACYYNDVNDTMRPTLLSRFK